MIFYFTGTGNSQYAAQKLADKVETLCGFDTLQVRDYSKFNLDYMNVFVKRMRPAQKKRRAHSALCMKRGCEKSRISPADLPDFFHSTFVVLFWRRHGGRLRDGHRWLRYSFALISVSFLKTLAKCAGSAYPTISPISPILRLGSASRRLACSIRSMLRISLKLFPA